MYTAIDFVHCATDICNRQCVVLTDIRSQKLSSKLDLTADFFKQAQIRTGEACGLSEHTVRRICSEAKHSEDKHYESKSVLSLKSPRKVYKRAKIVSELDDFDSDVVRRTVHEFYNRSEYPTANLILNDLKQKINYSGCLRSVRNLLKNFKFSYKKCNDGRKFLMEGNNIVALHDRLIVYIDETWVNQNHSRSIIWQNEYSTEGLKVPTGKGGRLIVCHAGCARYRFIQRFKLVFRSNIRNTAEIFQKWFVELLNNLEEPSVIVTNNASYHSTLVENYPKSNWRKSDVQKWLTEIILNLVRLIQREKQYLLNQIALENGHEVIRLPPYHRQYNPIELIWAHD
ncbi:Uncharacterized protein FWK35_00034501 [Aphis craccivora]|uniref:Tc1-like transposase DDE domain-containing protein n=1 Tax=Aphis craccivora TaxID=307492 RepID=A0A6G0VNF6_APHCR|nr:Uncharacterized protein FWK35_00034501 [Aphis craccivora]